MSQASRHEASRDEASSKERKRSLAIAGHRTSVSMEEPFWEALKQIAAGEARPLAALIADVDSRRGATNLSSALRLHALAHYRRLAGHERT